jgi:chemosensory pili system protein ChpC
MQNIREVYSLLIPIDHGRIILPRAAVAEVTAFMKPVERPENAPDFLLGYISWQNQMIPLVSFEAAAGKKVPETSRRSRIAVLFGVEGRLGKPNLFAMVTQGYPYLVRVNAGVLRNEELLDDDNPELVLARTRMANERPLIPNIGRLEEMTADALGLTGDEPETAAEEPVDELDALAATEEEFEEGLLDDLASDDTDSDTSDDAEESDINFDDISFDIDEEESPDKE